VDAVSIHTIIRTVTIAVVVVLSPLTARGIAVFGLELAIRRLGKRGESQQAMDAVRRLQESLRWGRRRRAGGRG
jgi:hypothetical protein